MEYLQKMFRVDTPTVNGRIYPREVVEAAIEEYMSREANLGELDHPEDLIINFDRVSHKVIDTFITDEGDWMTRIEVLKTPMGEVLEGLLTNGILPKLDPRSTGMVSDNFVVSDLHIVAIDVISEKQEKEIAQQAEEKEKETETTCSSTQDTPSEKDGSQES
jgi:hypothetical protein